MSQSLGPQLRYYWNSASRLPGGRWLFSRLLGLVVPYTGSIGAVVTTLEPGHCIAALADRRRVRNHLHSVHAMALCNLGELVSGLALLSGLPAGMRGILTGFSIEYEKKARGRLQAECTCAIPDSRQEQEVLLAGEIRDAADVVVARIQAKWRIGLESGG